MNQEAFKKALICFPALLRASGLGQLVGILGASFVKIRTVPFLSCQGRELAERSK